MKAAAFVFLLLLSGTVMRAQSRAVPSGDVTLRMREGTPEYCLGAAQGPNDITLRLPLKLRYENHRSERVFLPGAYSFEMKMTVVGQRASTIMRHGGGGTTDVNSPSFYTIALEKAESSTGRDLVQCLSATDPGCIFDFVMIPVLDRSSGLDLRGKTVQIVTTRDHSLAPEMAEKLKEKLKNSGTVFSGVVESEVVTFRISDEPLARNCTKPN